MGQAGKELTRKAAAMAGTIEICEHNWTASVSPQGTVSSGCMKCGCTIEQVISTELSALRSLRDAVGVFLADSDVDELGLRAAYQKAKEASDGK